MLAMVLMGGCKKDEPNIVGPPGGGGGGGGGTLTDSLRLVALDAFNAFAATLDYTNPAVYTRILQYFRSHPETYEAADTSDSFSIWARFKDGRLFIVSDGTRAPDSLTTMRAAPHSRSSLQSPLANLPSNQRARLLNALGAAFEPIGGEGAEGTVNTLSNWFSAAGYTPPVGTASVDGLKLVQGDGVFYFSSHGSWGKTRNTLPNGDTVTAYGIWTSDEVTRANEARFNADLSSNPARLCWYRALHNNNFFGDNRETHYAITAEFVRQYMSFGTNSLVFFNACASNAPTSADFSAACIAKHAGVYLGWSKNIDGMESLKAARFFFDRLLGAHEQEPLENPSQRPFEITYVLEDMLLRQFDVHLGNKGITNLVATPFFGYGGEPTLIAPTVQVATPPFIPGDSTLWIDGSYGDNPGANGTVLLGTTPLTIGRWTPIRIECVPPQSGGNLVVKVRGIKSNTIQLTEWHGQFTLVYRGPGTLQHRITLNLNFWTDIHNYRVLPHKPTNFWPLPRWTYVMTNSSCTFQSSGKHTSELDTNIIYESWSSAVTPPLSRKFTEPTFFGMTGMLDSLGRPSHLYLRFQGMFTRFLAGSGTSQQSFTPPGALGTIDIALTGGYAFPSGSIPWSSGDYSGTMTWGGMQPIHAPDPSGGW
jgi:hypothetical protein